MSIFEKAKQYYPRFGDKHRINALVKAEKLTRAQADEIINAEEREETT